jgi:hypothetical protein
MLGHYHVASHNKPVAQAHTFQRIFEQSTRLRQRQIRQPMITTESEKVKVPTLLEVNQSSWHRMKAYNGQRAESSKINSS